MEKTQAWLQVMLGMEPTPTHKASFICQMRISGVYRAEANQSRFADMMSEASQLWARVMAEPQRMWQAPC